MSVGFHNPKGSAPYKAQKGDLGMKHGMVGGGSASKRGYSLAAVVMVSIALAGLGAIFMVVIDRRSSSRVPAAVEESVPAKPAPAKPAPLMVLSKASDLSLYLYGIRGVRDPIHDCDYIEFTESKVVFVWRGTNLLAVVGGAK